LLATNHRHACCSIDNPYLEVLEEGVLLPLNTLLLVGVGVSETGDLARLAAEETVKLRANLVALASLQGVALCAAGLEEVGALLVVTWSGLLVVFGD
jgi:hypothetical protein